MLRSRHVISSSSRHPVDAVSLNNQMSGKIYEQISSVTPPTSPNQQKHASTSTSQPSRFKVSFPKQMQTMARSVLPRPTDRRRPSAPAICFVLFRELSLIEEKYKSAFEFSQPKICPSYCCWLKQEQANKPFGITLHHFGSTYFNDRATGANPTKDSKAHRPGFASSEHKHKGTTNSLPYMMGFE